MAILTVRNVPDEVHRALRLRAAQHGRSTEAEVRAILEQAVESPDRIKLGTLLSNLGRSIGLTNSDVDALEASIDANKDANPHEAMTFE